MKGNKIFTILTIFFVILGLQACGTSDQTITQNVQANLNSDKTLVGENITVETKDGIVTLTGAVSNTNQIQAAGRAAQSVADVKTVNNKLTLKPMTNPMATPQNPSTVPGGSAPATPISPATPQAVPQPNQTQAPGQTTSYNVPLTTQNGTQPDQTGQMGTQGTPSTGVTTAPAPAATASAPAPTDSTIIEQSSQPNVGTPLIGEDNRRLEEDNRRRPRR